MRPRVLVVTTVHSADDTRIRERLIRTLAPQWDVEFAAPPPGPTDKGSLTWIPLPGGRAARNWGALVNLCRRPWDVAVVHDPELVPAAIATRLLKRRPVVFDVHEDLPAQVLTKSWLPRLLRPLVAFLSRGLFRAAEIGLTLTLAEAGYGRRFRRSHPVFANYPRYEGWPAPTAVGDGTAVYVGDVQEQRGLVEAAIACKAAGIILQIVGPVESEFAERLAEAGGAVSFAGRLPNPAAIDLVAGASVGLSPLRPIPNYLESFPTKTVEYLAAGIPVVATDLPGTRHILRGLSAVWLVEPGDPEAMAEAIRRAVDPTSKALALDQVQRVRAEYAWPADEVEGFYRELISP